METLLGFGVFGLHSSELITNPSSPLPNRISPFHHLQRVPRKSPRVSASRSSLSGSELAGDDIIQIFLRERQFNGDFISKVSDALWRRDGLNFVDAQANVVDEITQPFEDSDNENPGGFLKLSKTQEWVSGNDTPPLNKKMAAKEWQNDSERRKRINLLKYDALKRELLLLTTGIGTACTGYCLVTLSVQAGVSYAAGVLFSCLYLQLLYHHADNLSKEAVPQIFMQKKLKKIGIRSEDLRNAFEKTVNGSIVALSSPRLVIPAAIYGFWGLSHNFTAFDFQLVPAMVGMFAYKAACLVQVYRDNEDLRFIFPESEDSVSN
ncbi:uncharacterized protein LOC131227495 [Magnolia sinica]|uniref:uncharacterized protein LOC131227495 n=1 Tax=Magnolia sinica TaxID=86752 RepID=UPI00265ADAC9|nr:uncharacterized protein LOC131227495 [Magnolia sinica]